MPIIGIQASANQQARSDTGAMVPLGLVQVGSAGTATITFSSIPSTYKHLQIRGIARTATNVSLGLRFNSDTGANYSRHFINGNGTAPGAGGNADYAFSWAGSAAQNALTYGANIIDILDYTNTNKYKTVKVISGGDNNGSGYMQIMSGNWRNTNAVTSIDIFQAEGNTITEYSSFALYGIKGS